MERGERRGRTGLWKADASSSHPLHFSFILHFFSTSLYLFMSMSRTLYFKIFFFCFCIALCIHHSASLSFESSLVSRIASPPLSFHFSFQPYADLSAFFSISLSLSLSRFYLLSVPFTLTITKGLNCDFIAKKVL